jgi:hypothetical protein
MGARWYDAYTSRFLSPDSIIPDFADPQSLNRFSYCLNNPLRYTDPSGHTVKSALDLIREYGKDIVSIAEEYGLDPLLLAGVVFAENRNDLNWIRGQDWSSVFGLGLFGGPEVKNFFGPLVDDNPATGITEVSLGVAAMMDDPSLVPDNYADLSYEERVDLQEQIAASLCADERQRILDYLSDPQIALDYAAKYLTFLGSYRDYGDNYALWLSDYNRGLSSWDTTSEYGRRIEVYEENIKHVLYWQEPDWPICIGRFGCAAYYDRMLYGSLP